MLLGLCLCQLAWPAAAPAALPPLLSLDRSGGAQSLAGHLALFTDTQSRYQLADVLALDTATHFTPLPSDLTVGFARHHAFWLHVGVQVPAGQDGEWWLAIEAPWVESLDVWLTPAASDEVLGEWQTGTLQPLSSRDLEASVMALRMVLPPGDYRLWMRASSDRAITLQAGFWQLPELAASRSRTEGGLLILHGMMLLMVFVGLLLGWYLGQPSLIWYGIYVLCMVIRGLAANGLLASLLLPDSPHLSGRLSAVTICMAYVAATQVAVHSFSLLQREPWLARLILGAGLMGLPAALLAGMGHYGLIAPFLHVLGLAILAVVMLAALWVMYRHYSVEILLHLGAMLMLVMPMLAILLQYLGLLAVSRLTLMPQVLVLGHLVLVFAGMAVRISSLRHKEAVAERERLRVGEEMNTLLEHQVAERTDALRLELQARSQAERRLNEMLKEQRSFLAMVSHEFRTPLTVMGLVVHNIGGRHEDNDETREDIVRATRANHRLMGLVDACLNNEWLDSTEVRLRPQWQDIARLLGELCEQRHIASGRDIMLSLPEQAVMLKVDTALIQVVFDNLIGNALKYASADAPVVVGVQPLPSGAVEIAVTDQGPGVSPDEQGRVFERYYRSPAVLSHSGIGLGLHIVRRIVTLHGGTVWLDADYHEGARFVVQLPPAEC